MASNYHRYETDQQLAERILAADAAEARDQIWAEGEARLAEFLALPVGHRAIVWRQLTDAARRELVIHQLHAAGRLLTDDTIDGTLAGLNDRWSDTPTATEAAIYGALDEAVEAAERAIVLADADQLGLANRERNAAIKARANVRLGYRPEQQADRSWLVRSATSAATYRIVSGSCDCQAGRNGRACWHVSAVAAVETGLDALDVGYAVELEYVAAAASIGRRLAAARAQYVAGL